MQREEIIIELKMPYHDLCDYLIIKYGECKYDYFSDKIRFVKNSKEISRTNEGLYCHHIDEDKGVRLSDASMAKKQPFEWQLRNRLVYCNLIEHLILHIKISIMRQKHKFINKLDMKYFITDGVFMIARELNDFFFSEKVASGWRKNCYDVIADNKEDYISILILYFSYYSNQCILKNREEAFLVLGNEFEGSARLDVLLNNNNINIKTNGTILRIVSIDTEYKTITVEQTKGSVIKICQYYLDDYFTIRDFVQINIREIARGFDSFYEEVVERIIDNKTTIDLSIADCLSVDFYGYGFSQYSKIIIKKEINDFFNADEYISFAFPSFSDSANELFDKKPVFWKGGIPKIVIDENLFFIIRVETAFQIKKECIPFVRYKVVDLLRPNPCMDITEDNNELFKNGYILSNSDKYDRKTDRYYSKYRSSDGTIRDYTVKISLTKKDYELFLNNYDVRVLRVLDGCYFVKSCNSVDSD